MDPEQRETALPDPTRVLRRHLAAARRVLLLDQAVDSLPIPPEASVVSELTDGDALDAIVVGDRSVSRESEIRSRLEEWRSALDENAKLLVQIEGAEEVPPVWIRVASELGFSPSHSAGMGNGSSLLVLQRDPYRMRGYRPGDEAAILDLFGRSFHRERSVERWAWAYRHNPWADREIALAEEPTGGLVAHYAGYGMPFWYRGRNFTSLQIGDTMTDPDFRRVGRGTRSLLARTVRYYFAVRRGGGFGFYYGFNTGPIQRFCSWFIGGMKVEPVDYRWRDDVAPPSSHGYRTERVDRTGPRFDRLFARVAPHYRYLVRRDTRYVDWRYRRCPDSDYRIYVARRWGRLVGWSVFRRRDDVLVWGDALFDPRHSEAARAILGHALSDEGSRDLRGVEAWFPDRPAWWHDQLRELGFERRPQPDDLGFMILPDAEREAPLDQLYYTMGDGDLF